MTETRVSPENKTTKPKKVVAEKILDKAKATPVKKAADTKKTTTIKGTVKSAAVKSATVKASTRDLESNYKLIELAAYLIAERDSFAGNPVDYWVKAEAKINQ